MQHTAVLNAILKNNPNLGFQLFSVFSEKSVMINLVLFMNNMTIFMVKVVLKLKQYVP
jgi:hypothetical protein